MRRKSYRNGKMATKYLEKRKCVFNYSKEEEH